MSTTLPKQFVFVLMPFDSAFDDIYTLGIKAACSDTGAYCERVDEQIFQESILERVYNQISKADIIVADMTNRNPNVFYEVGYAHALGKTVVLLTQNANDIPFDLKHYPHIVYGNSIVSLKEELERRLRWCIENPASSVPPELETLFFYLKGKTMQPGSIVGFPVLTRSESSFARVRLPLAIHNGGSGVLDLSHAQIGVIMPQEFQRCLEWETAQMPAGKCIHLIRELGVIPPGGWKPAVLSFDVYSLGEEIYGEWECVIRVFERVGYRDTPFKLQVSRQDASFEVDMEVDA